MSKYHAKVTSFVRVIPKVKNRGPNTRQAYFLNPYLSNGQSMKHWVLLIVHGNTVCYFDPLAKNPTAYLKEHRNKTIWHKIVKNKKFHSNIGTPIQSKDSQNCGLFVLGALWYISRGISLEMFLNKFSKTNLHRNDRKILNFIQKHFRTLLVDP